MLNKMLLWIVLCVRVSVEENFNPPPPPLPIVFTENGKLNVKLKFSELTELFYFSSFLACKSSFQLSAVKYNTKVITSTNHSRYKQRNEPI